MKSGFVAIAGAPNAGKSTFLNQVLGFKLAITSDKPQTTRHRILGVHTDERRQVVFLDTPGLHTPRRALNQRMVQTALDAMQEVDAVLFVAEASPRGLTEAAAVAPLVVKTGRPALLALNKVDLVSKKADLLPMLQQVDGWGRWAAVVPISALTGDGTERVLEELERLLPGDQPLFPDDMLTDLSERFLAAELIREKVFRLTEREVPYAVAVTVDEFLEPGAEGRPTAITATIHVERQGQKAIIIGKGGAMLKKIGTAARLDLERLLGAPVFLSLFVRVEPRWSQEDKGLRKLGY
ncbi:MAG: GTPase Era [Thermodesulfobacteriota bacterium]